VPRDASVTLSMTHPVLQGLPRGDWLNAPFAVLSISVLGVACYVMSMEALSETDAVATKIIDAMAIVSAQVDCSPNEALALLNTRARSGDLSLEELAFQVLAGELSFDHSDGDALASRRLRRRVESSDRLPTDHETNDERSDG
jgi:hypothetical protein